MACPGIHVSARNPPRPKRGPALGTGGAAPGDARSSRPTPWTRPFIFESLKNYFQKAGLRVFSAIHPIFTVRRQWERIVWMGGPRRRGQGALCHFQIERVDSKERLRRIEHEVSPS